MISSVKLFNCGNYSLQNNYPQQSVQFRGQKDDKQVKQEAMRKICGFGAIAAGVPLLAYLVLGLFTKGKSAKAAVNLAREAQKAEQTTAKAATQVIETAEKTAIKTEQSVANAVKADAVAETEAHRVAREAVERFKTRPKLTPNERFNSFVGKMRDTCRRACQGRPDDVCSVGEMIEQYQGRLMPKLIEKGVDKKLLQEFSDIFTNCKTRKVTDVMEQVEAFAQKLGV